MRYTGSLVKKEREQIFSLFIEHRERSFTQIEKAIGLRSNMVAYHLDCMEREGLIAKHGSLYSLTPSAERDIPLFPHITGKVLSPLPVVLVAVITKDRILLLKRSKRPYKDYLGLIGGRIHHDETIEEASIRLVHEKTGLEAQKPIIHAILHEHVMGQGMTKHSFIHFLTSIKTTDSPLSKRFLGALHWFDFGELPESSIIPSDLWLIQNKLQSTISISRATMVEEEGVLNDLRIPS